MHSHPSEVGQVGVALIRDLKDTLEREKATLAAFITLDPPTAPMVTEATTAGFYSPPHLPDQKYARIQLLTIEDLLTGRARLEYPRQWGGATTLKSAPRAKKSAPVPELDLDTDQE